MPRNKSPDNKAVEQQKRIETLEAKVAVLEEAMENFMRRVSGTDSAESSKAASSGPPSVPTEEPHAVEPLEAPDSQKETGKATIGPTPSSKPSETPVSHGFQLPKKEPEPEPTGSSPLVLMDRERRQIAVQLQRYSNLQICIKAAEGDVAARQFAEELKSLFIEAGWDVEGVHATRFVERGSQLVLSTGTFPVPKEIAVAFRALASVGLEPASQLDPNQFNERAVLIVNPPVHTSKGKGTPPSPPRK